MQDRGYVLVYIDSFGDERADYYVVVRAATGRLHALLFRDRPGPRRDRSIGYVNVWRATRRSLAFRVRLTKIYVGSRRRVLRWYVQTVFTSGTCRRVCFDRVPNSGMVEDDLPKPPDGG
jgi:hypothetical protein